MGTDLVGGDHERLVLDRSGAQQRLPVVARRRQRKRRRQHDHARAAHGEDPEQLGKAQVVTDRQAQLHAVGGYAGDDLLARLLDLGLVVGAAVDLDVEHVHLAVHRLDLTLGVHVYGGVRQLLDSCHTLSDRPSHQIYPQLACGLARPGDRGPVERLGPRAQLLV